jgi:hypothetical protein
MKNKKSDFSTIVEKAINELKLERPVFCSEADFQHSLAIKISNQNHDLSKIRLEKLIPLKENKRNYVDLFLNFENFKAVLELKYKTKKEIIFHDNEEFNLLGHGAQNLGSYAFFKDIQDIESLINKKQINMGMCLFLTNDSYYWREHSRESITKNFRISDKRKVGNEVLNWVKTKKTDPNQKDWVKKYPPLTIKNNYDLSWKEYSNLDNQHLFKYLLVPVIK